MLLGALVLLLAGAVGVAVMRLLAARRLARFQAGRLGAGYALALAERGGLGLPGLPSACGRQWS